MVIVVAAATSADLLSQIINVGIQQRGIQRRAKCAQRYNHARPSGIATQEEHARLLSFYS